ncbi:MAG: pitrilysin family protein [Bacteroidota bacterium]
MAQYLSHSQPSEKALHGIMIPFESFVLDNGLRVIVHEDPSSKLAAMNVMYHVGARDEEAQKTGLAHLLEHLMFGGSQHVPNYDQALQQVGGDSNAYTTPDVTNYYCTLPAVNLETAFWLESDRMLSPLLDAQILAVQQKVVTEEFKEIYLNQPYGDAWLQLSALAYEVHPYRWPVIGKDISHIARITLADVQAFFRKFYVPNNAVLVVAGDVQLPHVKQLSQKWFGPIPAGPVHTRRLPQEPVQTSPKSIHLSAPVPLNALYKAYHVPGRSSTDYHTAEALCNGLGAGKSSTLYRQLVQEKAYFSTIEACLTETLDPGLLIVHGILNGGISFEQAEAGLAEIFEEIQSHGMTSEELDKVKNHAETEWVCGAIDLPYRAQALALATWLGDAHLVNTEMERVRAITLADVKRMAHQLLNTGQGSTLYYHSTS